MTDKIRCILKVSNLDEQKLRNAFQKTLETTYDKKRPPKGTTFRLDGNYVEIIGQGEDWRCAFCEYLQKVVGKENVTFTCPYKSMQKSPEKIKEWYSNLMKRLKENDK